MTIKRDQFLCHRLYRDKETGMVSESFWDVLPQRLTVDPDYVFPTFDPGTWKTLFHEVEVVKPMDALTIQEKAIVLGPDRVWGCNKLGLLVSLSSGLKRAIKREWAPDKFHLILHTSGYDSRMISGTLLKLYYLLGKDWLGDVLFVCMGPESDEFLKIMDYEGWNENQYVTYPSMLYHFNFCLDFRNAWRWHNGPSNFSNYLNYTIVDRLQMQGLVPGNDNNIQLWTGRNDIAFQIWGGVDWSLGQCYEHNYGAVTSVVQYKVEDVALPIMSYEMMHTLAMAKVRVGWSTLRPDLLKHIDTGLSKFRRVEAEFPPLTSKQLTQMCKDYEASWYGVNVRPRYNTTRMINYYHDWWSNWICAAIVEHLIEEGYEISVS